MSITKRVLAFSGVAERATRDNMKSIGSSAVALLLLSAASALAQAPAQGDIPIAAGVFPENIAATAGGDLLITSISQGIVYRVRAGATAAEPWITDIGPVVTGVFSYGDSAYVCSNTQWGADQRSTLRVYDLATAQETAAYDLAVGTGSCSDIAVAPDGTIYVAQLGGAPGRIIRLKDGVFEDVIVDDALAGVDGLAFIGADLYVNNLGTGELYRINLDQQPVTFTTLTLSQPLQRPDGMRTTEDGTRLLIAEAGGNRIVSVAVNGDNAEVTEIVPNLTGGPTGVAQIGNTLYVVEGYFGAMAQNATLVAPDIFTVRPFPLR